MGLIFRKTARIGKNTHLNVSKTGVSATQRFGPISINSRGRVTIRLGRGLSFRL